MLTKRDGSIDIRDIVRDGYPFFSGEMTVRTAIEYKSGDPTAIKLGGRFAVCGARINGHDLGSKLFDDEFELGSYLKQGANELELTLCFSGRNLFGPHHCLVPEPPFVVPRSFSFEKMWNGDKCENYNPEYAFIRLGIGY